MIAVLPAKLVFFALLAAFGLVSPQTAFGQVAISPTTLAMGRVSVPYRQQLTINAQSGAVDGWIISDGSLPIGLTMSALTGLISGTPDSAGTFGFAVTVRISNGAAPVTSRLAITVLALPPAPEIEKPSLPTGTAGVTYPGFTFAVTANTGLAPFLWRLGAAGSPPGLALSAAGVLTGTPLQAGAFNFTVTVTDSLNRTSSGTFTLIASAGAALVVAPRSLDFSAPAGGDDPPSQSVIVLAGSNSAQNFGVLVDPNAAWLTVRPRVGAAPGRLTFHVDQTGLGAGTYSARVQIVPGAGQTAQDVSVKLVVKATAQTLDVVPRILRFAALLGGTLNQDQFVLVRNKGGNGPIPFVTSVVSKSAWITAVVPDSGRTLPNRPALVRIRVNPQGLALGLNRGIVRVTSPIGAEDVVVLLFVSETGSFIRLNPRGIRAEIQQGTDGTSALPIKIVNAGSPGSTLRWSADVVTGREALVVSPGQGTSTPGLPGQILVSASSGLSNLPAKPLYGLIRISDSQALNSPQYFPVILNVVDANTPPAPILDPQGLVFSGVTPVARQIQVSTSSISPVAFQASAGTDDGGSWLSVRPTSGVSSSKTPGTVSVAVNTSGLRPGVYRGEIDFSMGGVLRATNVTLIVNSGVASAAVKIRNAAGCAASQMNVTHTGLGTGFSTPAKWPMYLEVRLADDCGDAVVGGQIAINFSNGDPAQAMDAVDGQPGVYSATWAPGVITPSMTVNATAIALALETANSEIIGAVTENKAPSLASDGTVGNLNSLLGGALAPGGIVAIYGSNLAAAPASPSKLPLPTTLNGTTVLIGAVEAPLYYISGDQINAQIPTELAANKTYQIIVSANGALTLPDTIALTAVQPGVAAFGDGRLIAQHADFSLVDSVSPAKPGESITIYLTGLGATNPPVATGIEGPGASGLARVPSPPEVLVGGVKAVVGFAGLVPGAVGLYQVNFVVPADALTGNLVVTLTQNGVEANTSILPVRR